MTSTISCQSILFYLLSEQADNKLLQSSKWRMTKKTIFSNFCSTPQFSPPCAHCPNARSPLIADQASRGQQRRRHSPLCALPWRLMRRHSAPQFSPPCVHCPNVIFFLPTQVQNAALLFLSPCHAAPILLRALLCGVPPLPASPSRCCPPILPWPAPRHPILPRIAPCQSPPILPRPTASTSFCPILPRLSQQPAALLAASRWIISYNKLSQQPAALISSQQLSSATSSTCQQPAKESIVWQALPLASSSCQQPAALVSSQPKNLLYD